ncbi:MAG: glycosyltransferase, partial [Patescibacteria group bacterium]|nr:glycosyltransferase [Patescibacteria group bacterium]
MVTCIVPVYNNEKTIGHVIKTILSFDQVNEFIVIDNFSDDNTRKVIKSFGNKIHAIFNPRNLGKGGSVAKGIKIAKGDVIFL